MKKEAAIIKRIDDLGRVQIPNDIRKRLNIEEGDELEIFVGIGMGGKVIIIKKVKDLKETKEDMEDDLL